MNFLELVHEVAHGLTEDEWKIIDELLVEGKDLGTFKGDISPYKDELNSLGVTRNRADQREAARGVDRLVSQVAEDLKILLERYKRNEMSRQWFEDSAKAILKNAYHKAYDLGSAASGMKALSNHRSNDETKWVESAWKDEQKYFNRFLKDISRGESVVRSSKRIEAYAAALRSVFDSSKVLQQPEGYLLYWVMESDIPCEDCKLLHKLSPYTKWTIPTTPKAGRTRCLTRCYCKIRMEKASRVDLEKAESRNKSAKELLKKLKSNRKKR